MASPPLFYAKKNIGYLLAKRWQRGNIKVCGRYSVSFHLCSIFVIVAGIAKQATFLHGFKENFDYLKLCYNIWCIRS